MNPPVSTSTPAPAPAVPARKRKPALLAVAGITLALGLAYGGYWALYQRHFEATDNAYVQAPVVQVTPQVGGTVLAVLADDTDAVKAGQALVRLDPADAKLALERQQRAQADASTAANIAYDLALQRYQAGLGNFLTVLTAQTNVLAQSRASTDLKARHLASEVALNRALGGGYATADLPSAPPAAAVATR